MLEVTSAVPSAIIRRHDDGRVEIIEAPRVAEFSLEFLNLFPLNAVDEAGNLSIAGEVTYRPLRFSQDLTGRVKLICQRVI